MLALFQAHPCPGANEDLFVGPRATTVQFNQENQTVTVLLDPRNVVHANVYEWDPGLAQCLEAYCPLPAPSPSPPSYYGVGGEEDPPPLFRPHQHLIADQMFDRLSTRKTTSVDPMDVVHRLPITSGNESLWFTREGWIARGVTDPAGLPPPRLIDFHGNYFHTDNISSGKIRTVLTVLKRRQPSSPDSLWSTGRRPVSTMAVVALPESLPTWREEVPQVVPDWTVHYIDSGSALKGLARKLLRSPHLIVFTHRFLRKNASTLFSSSVEERGWTADHEALWTILFHTVVVEGADTLVSPHFMYRTETVVLSKVARLIKAVVAGRQ